LLRQARRAPGRAGLCGRHRREGRAAAAESRRGGRVFGLRARCGEERRRRGGGRRRGGCREERGEARRAGLQDGRAARDGEGLRGRGGDVSVAERGRL
ncbi:hypothetical protein LTR39_004211, partial [Cryomyces antarcticus]